MAAMCAEALFIAARVGSTVTVTAFGLHLESGYTVKFTPIGEPPYQRCPPDLLFEHDQATSSPPTLGVYPFSYKESWTCDKRQKSVKINKLAVLIVDIGPPAQAVTAGRSAAKQVARKPRGKARRRS